MVMVGNDPRSFYLSNKLGAGPVFNFPTSHSPSRLLLELPQYPQMKKSTNTKLIGSPQIIGLLGWKGYLAYRRSNTK